MMGSQKLRLTVLLSAVALFAAPAHTSVPGSDLAVLGGLQHVCEDNVPADGQEIVCVDREGPFLNSPYTGIECPQPTTCHVDTIPGVKLAMTAQLMRDENTLVSNTSGVPFPDPPIDVGDSAGMLLTFRIGHHFFQLLDLFSGTQVGNWNTFFENEIFQDVDLPEADHPQYFSHNLVDLGEALTAIADKSFPQDLSDAVPYMIATRYRRHIQSDQSAEDEPLASFSRHRLRVGWVRVLP
jgi:hypothetical protein